MLVFHQIRKRKFHRTSSLFTKVIITMLKVPISLAYVNHKQTNKQQTNKLANKQKHKQTENCAMKKKLLEKRKETKLMIPLLFVKLLSTTRKQIKNHKIILWW